MNGGEDMAVPAGGRVTDRLFFWAQKKPEPTNMTATVAQYIQVSAQAKGGGLELHPKDGTAGG